MDPRRRPSPPEHRGTPPRGCLEKTDCRRFRRRTRALRSRDAAGPRRSGARPLCADVDPHPGAACEMMSDLAVDPARRKSNCCGSRRSWKARRRSCPGRGSLRSRTLARRRAAEAHRREPAAGRNARLRREGGPVEIGAPARVFDQGAAVDVARHQNRRGARAQDRPLPWSEAGRMWSTFENDWEAHGNPLQHSSGWIPLLLLAERGCRAVSDFSASPA